MGYNNNQVIIKFWSMWRQFQDGGAPLHDEILETR